MTIKLRPETVKNIEPKIARFIEQTTVTSGSIIDILSSYTVLWEAEALLPKEGPTRQQLDRFVGEQALATFIPDELRERLAGQKYDIEKPREPLLKVLGIEDPLPLARELLQALEALPRAYQFTLPLPNALSDFVERLPPVRSFGPAVRLVHDADEIRRVIEPKTQSGLLANALMNLSVSGPLGARAALQVRVEGFVPRFARSETADEAHGLLKSFFGLGIAVGLLKTADYPQPQASRLNILVHLANGDDAAPLSKIPLTDAETTALSGLSYAAKSPRDRTDLTDAEQRMADMEAILSAPEQHQLLLRACRWLFDSHVSEDPLLSFVQATVVLEILLGDKASSDEVGLTALLANRCAYMIGASTSERSNIIKNFKALYGTRSKIVHSGKHRLSSSEQIQLHQLRALGRRVICAEIRLAIEEIRRERMRAAAQQRLASRSRAIR
jgi:hypothetical protein